jgi:hypothetical protein
MTAHRTETTGARLRRVLGSFFQADDKLRWISTKVENRRRHYLWVKFEKRLKHEQLINEAFDRRHGTDTAQEVSLIDAGVPADQSGRGNVVYRPDWESEFHASLAALDISFDGFAFVDIGSGKGKLLLLASDYPFARVVGIEYAPRLHAIAQENIARYRSSRQRCHALEAVLGDALTYRLPDGPLVGYIFNAMDATSTKALMEHVDDELGSRAEPAFVVYRNARHVRENADGFASVRKLRRLKSDANLLVFGNAAAQQRQRRPRS